MYFPVPYKNNILPNVLKMEVIGSTSSQFSQEEEHVLCSCVEANKAFMTGSGGTIQVKAARKAKWQELAEVLNRFDICFIWPCVI